MGYARYKYVIPGATCGLFLCWSLSWLCYTVHLLFLPEERIQRCSADGSHAPAQKPFRSCILTRIASVSDSPNPQGRRESPKLCAFKMQPLKHS